MILDLVFVFVFAIVLHEIGHIISFMVDLKRFPKIRFSFSGIRIGSPEDYIEMSKQSRIDIYLWGVIYGFGFIAAFAVLDNLFFLIILIPYLALCRKDISNIIRELKNV